MDTTALVIVLVVFVLITITLLLWNRKDKSTIRWWWGNAGAEVKPEEPAV